MKMFGAWSRPKPRSGNAIERMNRTVRFWRKVLQIALFALFLLFVKTLFSQISVPPISSFGAQIILKASFAIYMYCWYYGANSDLSIQNDVLRDAPVPAKDQIGLAILLFAAFTLLFYVDDPKLLSLVFILFLMLNVFGWLLIRRLLFSLGQQAVKRYRDTGDVVQEVKTRIYHDYMFGLWQKWRFATGFAMLAALLGISVGGLSFPGFQQDVTFSCMVALTILVLESWIWYRRVKLRIQWDGLEWLSTNGFIVEPKR